MIPTLVIPKFDLVVPSTGAHIAYRPFLMKEQKVLLIAQEDGTELAMLRAVHEVVSVCTFGAIDTITSPMFDVQFAYLQIRAKSVGEIADFSLICSNCNHNTPTQLDLTKISIEKIPGHSKKIALTDTMGVIMKYPTIDHLGLLAGATPIYEIIGACIETIYDGDEVYKIAEETPENIALFIDQLTIAQFEKIQQFFKTMPVLRHELEYTCAKCAVHHTVSIEGIESFFV